MCLNACDAESSTKRRSKPELVRYSTGKNIYIKRIFNKFIDQKRGKNNPLKFLKINAKYLFNNKLESSFRNSMCRLNFLVIYFKANGLLHIVTPQNIMPCIRSSYKNFGEIYRLMLTNQST